MKTYNKLVRDNIPQIIERSGKTCTTRVLDEVEYLSQLNKKLLEEVAEYQTSGEVEELADIVEVVYAIAVAKGITVADLDSIRQAKADTNGAFVKRIFLQSVSD